MNPRWSKKTILLIALSLVLAVQTTACSSTPEKPDDEVAASAADAEEVVPDSDILPVGDSPILGDPQAPVTVMEFSSMTCPFCARAEASMKALVERYDGQVRVVFKHYPLGSSAEFISRILEATRLQDEEVFWEMKTALFDRVIDQRAQPTTDLGVELAENLGLDGEQLRRDVESADVAMKVRRDLEMGYQMGVRGTPHFFVNGEVVNGAKPVEEFATVVDRQLEIVDELLDEGVDEADVYDEALEHNLGTQ